MFKYILFFVFTLLPASAIPLFSPFDIYGLFLSAISLLTFIFGRLKYPRIISSFVLLIFFVFLVFITQFPFLIDNCFDFRIFGIYLRFLMIALITPMVYVDLINTKVTLNNSLKLFQFSFACLILSSLLAPFFGPSNVSHYGLSFCPLGKFRCFYLPIVSLVNPAFLLSIRQLRLINPHLIKFVVFIILLSTLLSGTRTAFAVITTFIVLSILHNLKSKNVIKSIPFLVLGFFGLNQFIVYLLSNEVKLGPFRSLVGLVDISSVGILASLQKSRGSSWDFLSQPSLFGNPIDVCKYILNTDSLSLDSSYLLFLMFGGLVSISILILLQIVLTYMFFNKSHLSSVTTLILSVVLISPHTTEIFNVTPGYLFFPFAISAFLFMNSFPPNHTSQSDILH